MPKVEPETAPQDIANLTLPRLKKTWPNFIRVDGSFSQTGEPAGAYCGENPACQLDWHVLTLATAAGLYANQVRIGPRLKPPWSSAFRVFSKPR